MPKLFSFNTGFIFSIERETGIEPATPSLARRCSTTEPLAHNTNIKFAVAYKLAPTNTSISDFNFCVNLFLQISCNFSATFVTNAPPIIKSAFAFIIKNHQKTDRRANPVKKLHLSHGSPFLLTNPTPLTVAQRHQALPELPADFPYQCRTALKGQSGAYCIRPIRTACILSVSFHRP